MHTVVFFLCCSQTSVLVGFHISLEEVLSKIQMGSCSPLTRLLLLEVDHEQIHLIWRQLEL